MAEPRRIALMPGDGIGQEVMAAAAEVLQALDKLTPLGLSWDWLEWPSTDWHRRHGEMMPADAMAQVQAYDALLMGALGMCAQGLIFCAAPHCPAAQATQP